MGFDSDMFKKERRPSANSPYLPVPVTEKSTGYVTRAPTNDMRVNILRKRM
jgi:hypothetical protein